MEFLRRKVIDMPGNRDINLPDPVNPEVQTILDNMTNRINNVTNNFIKTKCDKKCNILERNLKAEQQRGL